MAQNTLACATSRVPPALPSAVVQIALFSQVLPRKHIKTLEGKSMLQSQSESAALIDCRAQEWWLPVGWNPLTLAAAA